MWEKIKFIISEIGAELWPFIKRFLAAESRLLMESAQRAVMRVAADKSLQNASWQHKLSAAVTYVAEDMATAGVQVGISMMVDAVQVKYATFKKETP